MPHIVDPRRQVEANLERLQAEHEPGIEEARQAVAAAAGRSARAAAKQELKARQRAYKEARRKAGAILRAPMSW